jgi:hypothetical protein
MLDMNEAKNSQFNDQSSLGNPSRLRWLFPLSLIALNISIAALLLLMRATAIFQIPQSFFPLLTIGGLLSCFSFGILLLIRALRLMNMTVAQQNGLTLVTVLPVVAGMLALLPFVELAMVGVLPLCLVYFLGFAAVLELINRAGFKNRAGEIHSCENENENENENEVDLLAQAESQQVLDDSPVFFDEELTAESLDMIDEKNEALFEALLGQDDSTRELIEVDESEENRSQWMNRTTDPEGVDLVEGGALVQFSRNQKVSIVHIGLFPPLKGKLSVACDFESGMPVRYRVLETRGYGISVEVKRTQELDAEFDTYLHYRVTNQPFNEEVA